MTADVVLLVHHACILTLLFPWLMNDLLRPPANGIIIRCCRNTLEASKEEGELCGNAAAVSVMLRLQRCTRVCVGVCIRKGGM